ncbi:uncharacterized protein LOC113368333 [Ctenocephalides felis]|uniref:uncharacterized protein LOC113368140 n=1 Tax=Ctenocephalides felis TaxID=7515 RepID=UPI000E6E13BF|nr:uncharacterized protein LOC113368140 [Ctenocephalides felis]XP_026465666.1 uncharacterized protein LOC113368333 [Ctenocephalides felis]
MLKFLAFIVLIAVAVDAFPSEISKPIEADALQTSENNKNIAIIQNRNDLETAESARRFFGYRPYHRGYHFYHGYPSYHGYHGFYGYPYHGYHYYHGYPGCFHCFHG